jgi:polygalacturonase
MMGSCVEQDITPNQCKGTDTQRIRSAIERAKTSSGKVVIPPDNANGTNLWLLDSAILLPGNMTILLDNCTIQLSDHCRDNMFRSENVGKGITDPEKIENISIIGLGEVVLRGAHNPRSTGDGARTLAGDPVAEKEKGNWRVSYGSDAGKEGRKQTGDWRNIMILMAHVDGFKLKNINIENSHAWAVSFERVRNADISDIRFNNPEEVSVGGRKVMVSNKDGINLRHGCKHFRIDNISGRTGDDFIALSSLDTGPTGHTNGSLNSTMVTSRKWSGPEDDTEDVVITNISCRTKYRGIAIRASDSASIHHVFIDGLITREWNGYTNAMLIGGIGYGKPSLSGKIHNIHAMNLTGEGHSLVLIEAPIANCTFTNGIYTGDGQEVITYKINKAKTSNIITRNLLSIQ